MDPAFTTTTTPFERGMTSYPAADLERMRREVGRLSGMHPGGGLLGGLSVVGGNVLTGDPIVEPFIAEIRPNGPRTPTEINGADDLPGYLYWVERNEVVSGPALLPFNHVNFAAPPELIDDDPTTPNPNALIVAAANLAEWLPNTHAVEYGRKVLVYPIRETFTVNFDYGAVRFMFEAAPAAFIYGRIDSSVEIAPGNKWRYFCRQVAYTGSESDPSFATQTSPNVTFPNCYNTIENPNRSDGSIMGNGVDITGDDYPAGFSPVPLGPGAIVRLTPTGVGPAPNVNPEGYFDNRAYLFTAVHQDDGTCQVGAGG